MIDRDLLILNDAVTAFYGHLSAGRFGECFRLLDPFVTVQPMGQDLASYCANLAAYTKALPRPLRVERIELTLADGASALYGDRDFAHGRTTVVDAAGTKRTYQERWVKNDGLWYTRCVGYWAEND